jgi:hypothetical protein
VRGSKDTTCPEAHALRHRLCCGVGSNNGFTCEFARWLAAGRVACFAVVFVFFVGSRLRLGSVFAGAAAGRVAGAAACCDVLRAFFALARRRLALLFGRHL